MTEGTEQKLCSRCLQYRPATEEFFYKSLRHRSGLFSWCKRCQIKNQRKYYRAKRMRECSRCGLKLPMTGTFFFRLRTNRDGWSVWCKTCQSAYRSRWQQKASRQLMQTYRERKVALLQLLGGRCVDCGFSGHPAALDFDHVDPGRKRFALGANLNRKWSDVLVEAEKCQIRCANCHRIRTYEAGHCRTGAGVPDWFPPLGVRVGNGALVALAPKGGG